MEAWVVFIDADARRSYDEDAIVYSQEACVKHMRELRKMGFDKPVFKRYANEGEYYKLKDERA